MIDPVYYTTSRAKLEIKPCPFCGSGETSLQVVDGTMRVTCINCKARGPISDIVDPREGDAIIAWNQRIGDG